MKIFRIFPLVAALAATGCVTHPYQAAMPNLSGECAVSLASVDAIPMRYHNEADKKEASFVEFASLSHCLRMSDGAAMPVALFRFEDVAPPAHVHIAVMLSTGGTFAASIETLDAARQPLGHFGFDRFVRRGSQYSLDLFLNPTEPMPAYLLLVPDGKQVGKVDTALGSASQAVPIVGPGAMWMYSSGIETSTARPFMQGGEVLISVVPETAATLSTK